jgi:hypothetical protein
MKPDFKIAKLKEETGGPPPNNFNLENNFRLPRFQKTSGVKLP